MLTNLLRAMLLIVSVSVSGTTMSNAWAHGADEHAAVGIDGKLSAVALIAGALLYGLGILRGAHVSTARIGLFAAGCVLLALALVWPLDGFADRSLAAHMLQHMILLVVVPPLLVTANPLAVFLRGMGRSARIAGAYLAGIPLSGRRYEALLITATMAQAAVMSVWHVPWFYDLAVRDPLVHVLEHATIIIGAVWFWWLVSRAPVRGGIGHALFMMFLTLLHIGMLGGLITFARSPLYGAYRTMDVSINELLGDQQLAGLIMWVPAGLAYIAGGLWLLLRLLGPDDEPAPLSGNCS
jgi:putative membrane protein